MEAAVVPAGFQDVVTEEWILRPRVSHVRWRFLELNAGIGPAHLVGPVVVGVIVVRIMEVKVDGAVQLLRLRWIGGSEPAGQGQHGRSNHDHATTSHSCVLQTRASRSSLWIQSLA